MKEYKVGTPIPPNTGIGIGYWGGAEGIGGWGPKVLGPNTPGVLGYLGKRKKEDEEKWRQASSIRSQIGQGERCDVGRYDVGITRADGQLAGARRGARRPSLINSKKKEDEEKWRQASSIRSQIRH